MTNQPNETTDERTLLSRHRLLSNTRFEIVPTPDAADLTRRLPTGSTVHVMCPPLPGRQSGSVNLKGHLQGADSALDVAVEVAALGHRVVPHITAKTVRSRGHLEELLSRMAESGIDEGFFPGGDGTDSVGPYESAVELLDDLAEMGHHLREIGVGGYPEGHREIPPEVLLDALLHKQTVATFMVTEMCFEPAQTVSWLRETRSAGVTLPLYVGAPGAVGMRKLLEQLKHWGVGSAVRFLRKQHGMTAAILRRRFSPALILDGIAPSAHDEELAIDGLQLFTLNDVAATEAWHSKAMDETSRAVG